MTDSPAEGAQLDPATERALAVALFDHVWTLLAAPDRTAAQTDEMIHAAHASRHHWGIVGEPSNLARGEWQCSRVYAALGRGEPALWHAHRCLEIVEAAGIGDWDLAAACEAMARASAVAGDGEAARAWAERTRVACAAIAEDEDRRIVEADIATLPLG